MPAFALHVDSCKRLFEHYKLRKQSLQFALVAVGSVMTDLEEFGILKNVHWRAEEFFKHLIKNDPKYAPIALGMIMHEEMDKTLDKHYVEPNSIHANAILEKHNGKTFHNEGHYFLDHVMTCAFVQEEPSIVALAERAKKRLCDRHFSKIAYHLTSFFGGDENTVTSALQRFNQFDLTTYLSSEKIADMYGKFSLFHDTIDPAKRTLLDRAKLALRYAAFILTNKKKRIQHATEDAKKTFTNHKTAYKRACKAMVKRFSKLNATYNMGIK